MTHSCGISLSKHLQGSFVDSELLSRFRIKDISTISNRVSPKWRYNSPSWKIPSTNKQGDRENREARRSIDSRALRRGGSVRWSIGPLGRVWRGPGKWSLHYCSRPCIWKRAGVSLLTNQRILFRQRLKQVGHAVPLSTRRSNRPDTRAPRNCIARFPSLSLPLD